MQAVNWIAHIHFMDALTNLSFNYSLTILLQDTQKTSSCPRFGTRALIGGRRSVSVSTTSYRRWQQQLGVVKTQYFGTDQVRRHWTWSWWSGDAGAARHYDFQNVVFRCEFCASEFQPPITGHWSSMEMYFHFLRCLWCTEHCINSKAKKKILLLGTIKRLAMRQRVVFRRVGMKKSAGDRGTQYEI